MSRVPRWAPLIDAFLEKAWQKLQSDSNDCLGFVTACKLTVIIAHGKNCRAFFTVVWVL